MSRLSKIIRDRVDLDILSPNTIVMWVLGRYAKGQSKEVMEIVHDTIEALEDAEFTSDEKRNIAKKIIIAAVRRTLGITLPGFVAGLIIEWVVALRRTAEQDTKDTTGELGVIEVPEEGNRL